MKQLTDQEYVAKGGGACPFCGGNEFSGQEVNIDGDSASQEVCCDTCGNEWVDLYRLVGYMVTS